MNNSKTLLSKISNNIFLVFCIFLISFVWINHYLHSQQLSFIASLIIIFAFCIIFYPIKSKQLKKQNNNLSTLKNKDTLKTQILLGNNKYTIDKIVSSFSINNISKISENHYISTNDITDFFFIFHEKELSESSIINIYKSKIYNNIKIFCISSITFPIDKNCKFEIIDLDEIYNQFSNTNISFDNKITIPTKQKISKKELLKVIFNKSKSKNYFLFGLLLISTSFFTPYYIYYITIGTCLLLVALYSKFNKQFNK